MIKKPPKIWQIICKCVLFMCILSKKIKMKLIISLCWLFAIITFSFFAFVFADDCFDTVIDRDWNVYYVDPFNIWRVTMDKKALVSEYWDEIRCTGEKKIYSEAEYMENLLFELNYWHVQNKHSSFLWSILELTSWVFSLIIELIMLILSLVAMRKIFVKAWKPGINSIIPIYNFYELSDIAWLQWMFWKAFLCWLGWIVLSLFVPLLWVILVLLSSFYGVMVNFYVARNFWWSTFASILYVIFNPIAMLILAFWNDKYFLEEHREKMKAMKAKMNEIDNNYNKNNDKNELFESELSNWQIDNSVSEISIKYPDTNNFI